jgi:hypothetical protein
MEIGGPILPSARSVVVPQNEIHDVGLAVEQPEQTHPQDARVAVQPVCTTRNAEARAKLLVAEFIELQNRTQLRDSADYKRYAPFLMSGIESSTQIAPSRQAARIRR